VALSVTVTQPKFYKEYNMKFLSNSLLICTFSLFLLSCDDDPDNLENVGDEIENATDNAADDIDNAL